MQAGNLLQSSDPFQGLDYFLACGDAARLDSKAQVNLIHQWMHAAMTQGAFDAFKLTECSIIDYAKRATFPVYEVLIRIGLQSQIHLVDPTHLTKEMSIVMHVHDT